MEKHRLLEELYSRVDQLPTLPAVLPKLMQLAEDPDSSAADITKAIAPDPSLTAKVLTVANSAYYGFSKTVASLDRAVPLLGIQTIKSLALTMGVIRSLPAGNAPENFSREKLWVHSLTVATAMDQLGRITGFGTNYLFTIGLLHDVGIIVLDQFFPEIFASVLDAVAEDPELSLTTAERKALGFDHGQVGAFLLGRWKFPKIITQPIEGHHQEKTPKETSRVDLALLRTADAIAQEISWAGYETAPAPPYLNDDLEYLDVDNEKRDQIIDNIAQQQEEIDAFFSAMV